MSSPLDRLEDGYPHGTIEGERGGCIGSSCPATPITCAEIGASYRSDFRFRRLYVTGLRGADLVEAWKLDKSPAIPAVETPAPDAEPTSRRDRWDDLTQEQRDIELIEMFEVEELSFAQIATEIGKSYAGPVARMVKAACDRRDAASVTESAPTGPESEAAVPEAAPDVPVPPASVPAAGLEVEVLEGPRMARQQMWVVLDEEGSVLFASPDPATATESLAAAWRVRLAEINEKGMAA